MINPSTYLAINPPNRLFLLILKQAISNATAHCTTNLLFTIQEQSRLIVLMRPMSPCYILTIKSHQPEQVEAKSIEQILNRQQPGLLGMEFVTTDDGHNITHTYWSDLESIRFWNMQEHHLTQQCELRRSLYQKLQLDISKYEGPLQ